MGMFMVIFLVVASVIFFIHRDAVVIHSKE